MACVETSLMKCPDPTPSNLVHGLLKAMRDGTPCARAAQGWQSLAPPGGPGPLLLLAGLLGLLPRL
jgi:hypothetical protein